MPTFSTRQSCTVSRPRERQAVTMISLCFDTKAAYSSRQNTMRRKGSLPLLATLVGNGDYEKASRSLSFLRSRPRTTRMTNSENSPHLAANFIDVRYLFLFLFFCCARRWHSRIYRSYQVRLGEVPSANMFWQGLGAMAARLFHSLGVGSL